MRQEERKGGKESKGQKRRGDKAKTMERIG